jgi:DNA (cytosine-5)-methyltransferase 1
MSRGVVVDLFCGAGGASLGFVQAGYTVAGAVDLDDEALDTYERNLCGGYLDEYPGKVTFDSPLKGNLNSNDDDHVTFDDIRNEFDLERGEVDVIAGCPPCQNFSTLRDTTPWPEDEPKDDLLQSYVELIRAEKPGAVFFENVQGITNKGDGETTYSQWFKDQMRTMARDDDPEEKGYGANLKVVNAADYGIPQRRRRTIGIYIYGASESDIEFPPETHAKDPDYESKEEWVSISDVLQKEYEEGRLKPDLNLGQKQVDIDGYPDDPSHRSRRHRNDTVETMKAIRKHGDSWKDLRGTEDEEYIRECHDDLGTEAGAAYGILDWESPAPTLTTRCTNFSSGRFTHPEENRTITFREAALLMMFPSDFELPDKNSAAERVVGNAVPPQLVKTLVCDLDLVKRCPTNGPNETRIVEPAPNRK